MSNTQILGPRRAAAYVKAASPARCRPTCPAPTMTRLPMAFPPGSLPICGFRWACSRWPSPARRPHRRRNRQALRGAVGRRRPRWRSPKFPIPWRGEVSGWAALVASASLLVDQRVAARKEPTAAATSTTPAPATTVSVRSRRAPVVPCGHQALSGLDHVGRGVPLRDRLQPPGLERLREECGRPE